MNSHEEIIKPQLPLQVCIILINDHDLLRVKKPSTSCNED